MGKLIISAGGGSVSGSDDTSTVAAHVLNGDTYIGSDTDDEVGVGTMANVGAVDPAKSLLFSNNILYARMTNGAHITNASSGYPEVSIPSQTKTATPSASAQTISPDSGKVLEKVTVNGVTNLTAANIKNGVTVGGTKGTFTSDATLSSASDLLTGKIAYGANNTKYTGTMATLAGGTYTPTTSQQTISCSGKKMTSNIIIDAIPSNYVNISGGATVFKDGQYSPLVGGGCCPYKVGNIKTPYKVTIKQTTYGSTFPVYDYDTMNLDGSLGDVFNYPINLDNVSSIQVTYEIDTFCYVTDDQHDDYISFAGYIVLVQTDTDRTTANGLTLTRDDGYISQMGSAILLDNISTNGLYPKQTVVTANVSSYTGNYYLGFRVTTNSHEELSIITITEVKLL